MSVDMHSSAKYMVSHFTEWLGQMNHRGRPRPGSDILFPVLNAHVQECVMWKVCLLQCASLIMVFPSISVSHTLSSLPSLHTSCPPPSPSHEDPTSLGRDVLPLKLHGEFCLSPARLPQQHASVHHTASSLAAHLSSDIFSTHAAEFVQPFLRGKKIPKRSFSFFPVHNFFILLVPSLAYALQTTHLFFFSFWNISW